MDSSKLLKKRYHVIGLMSGTSLDGLDICECLFYFDGNWSYEILATETLSYPQYWKEKLTHFPPLSSPELSQLDIEYGTFLGETVQSFIQRHTIHSIDAIASHGHTLYHQPDKGITVQIGAGEEIHRITQLPVMYDFRSGDVQLGGQGAPLVPIGDQLLFSDYDACLNLGGFSNISFEKEGKRIAFDICPVNIVLNALAQQLGKDYDAQGELAKSGKLQPEVIQQLNALDYYQNKPPKSLGKEWVDEHIWSIIQSLRPEDALATFSAHVAEQLAQVFHQYELTNVLITGGGVYNSYMIETLTKLSPTQLIIPETSLIEYKEALIFALMGVLRLRNENNILSSVTGAKYDHCGGKMFFRC